MKPFAPTAVALLGLSLALLPGAARAATPSETPAPAGTLQVQVHIPPTWRPMMEEDVADALTGRMRDIFRQEGYRGKIVGVRSYDEPSPGCCLLTIDLIEWRISISGHIDCTFSADLQTKNHSRHLGIFNGMAFRWMSEPGRFGLADTFDRAADQAVRNLYDSIARSGLLPGLNHH